MPTRLLLPSAPLRGAAVVGALAALVLTGCGSTGDDADPAADGAEAPAAVDTGGLPLCDEVWVAGGTLPRGYRACAEVDGPTVVEVPRDALGCSSGQRLVRYETFYAVPGGVVQEGTDPLDEDPGWTDTVRTCRG